MKAKKKIIFNFFLFHAWNQIDMNICNYLKGCENNYLCRQHVLYVAHGYKKVRALDFFLIKKNNNNLETSKTFCYNNIVSKIISPVLP